MRSRRSTDARKLGRVNERAYHRAAEELAVVKREAVELKVTYKKGHSYN